MSAGLIAVFAMLFGAAITLVSLSDGKSDHTKTLKLAKETISTQSEAIEKQREAIDNLLRVIDRQDDLIQKLMKR